MTDDSPDAIQALDRLLDQAGALASQRDGEAVVYLGSVQDAIPRLLILDNDIPATALRVWMLLRIQIDDPTLASMVPSYPEIMRVLGIGSRDTMRNSFYYLRMTRWITLINRKTNRFGYNRGNVYALHFHTLFGHRYRSA